MPRQEEQKFLDLDLVAQQVQDVNDRSLFQEAVSCYYAGSHRAAAILAWYAAANCLKRRIFELTAEGDGVAQKAAEALTPPGGGDSQIGEEARLLSAAQDCTLIDDIEYKSLEFAREMRNKCAHPTGFDPSAEAIRHVLFICSQYVLCRTGWRGAAFIKDVVTTQFDDPNFLPDYSKLQRHCRELVDRVPKRLWPQFVKIAAQERARSHTPVWRQNAQTFFGHMFKEADDGLIAILATSLQMFEPIDRDLYATLVGSEPRIAQSVSQHKREQLREYLRSSSPTQLEPDKIRAWAMFCAIDGFEDKDGELLQTKFTIIARHVRGEVQFLNNCRQNLVPIIAELLRNDSSSNLAAGGCAYLFSTAAFDRIDSIDDREVEAWQYAISSIISEVVSRFVREDKHRKLLEQVREWNTTLLVRLLESASEFWAECSEENAEDVSILFRAREILLDRYPLLVPPVFSETIGRIIVGSLFPEWQSEESEAGKVFRSNLSEEDTAKVGASVPAPSFSTGETDDFWKSNLGVQISTSQNEILRIIALEHPLSFNEVAERLALDPNELAQGIEYLALQGFLTQKDKLYVLRDDIRELLLSRP